MAVTPSLLSLYYTAVFLYSRAVVRLYRCTVVWYLTILLYCCTYCIVL